MAINNPNVAGDPYSYDLKWLIAEIKKLTEKVEDIKDLQMIKYANPFQWDITKSYVKNTMVLDPASGDVYLSVQAVPYNTDITDSDYWTLVFNYKGLLSNIESSIGTEQAESWTAVKDYTKGDLFWIYDDLYRVTSAVKTGDNLQLKSEKVIISDLLKTFYVDNYSGNAEGDYSINGGTVNITGDEVNISSTVSHLNLGENLQFGTVEKNENNLSCIAILDKDGNDVNLVTDATKAKKKVLLIGDSYSYGIGSENKHGWSYFLSKKTENEYEIIKIISQPSGGFYAVGDASSTYPNKNFADALLTWCSENSNLSKKIDMVIIQSGWNDCNTTKTPSWDYLKTGVDNFINAVKQNFSKNVKVFAFPTWSCGKAIDIYSQTRLVSAIAETFNNNGYCSCQYACGWFTHREDLISTTNHYTEKGYEEMGNLMLAFIHGWDGNIIFGANYITSDLSSANGYIVTSGDTFNSNLYIGIDVTSFPATTDIIATIPEKFRPARYEYIPFSYYESGVGSKEIMLQIKINGEITILKSADAPSGGGRILGRINYPRWWSNL